MINCHSSFSSGQENHSMVTSLSSSFLSCQRQGSIYETVCCYDRLQGRCAVWYACDSEECAH